MLRLTICRSACLGCQAPIWEPPPILLLSLIIFRQLRDCWCVALSLTRGQVCSFQLLLGIDNAVFLGSKFRGTHDHILLFLFLRLFQPRRPGFCIYFPREQGRPVTSPRIGFTDATQNWLSIPSFKPIQIKCKIIILKFLCVLFPHWEAFSSSIIVISLSHVFNRLTLRVYTVLSLIHFEHISCIPWLWHLFSIWSAVL
jgi:hypothetical protein